MAVLEIVDLSVKKEAMISLEIKYYIFCLKDLTSNNLYNYKLKKRWEYVLGEILKNFSSPFW